MSEASHQAAAGAPAQHPPGWYPDPFGRHETRWWDGRQWTEHVASHGRQAVDPPTGGSYVPTVDRATEKVVRDVQSVGGAVGQGGGSIFTEPVLVVNQKAKLIEVNNEYAIYDQHGRQLGAVRQVGQSMAKKAIRVLTSYDQFMTHKLQVVDLHGNVLMALTRPAKVLKSRVIVQDQMGNEVGQIVQQNAIGKIRFALGLGRPHVGLDQRRELAGLELQHPGPHRRRGRPHHQDVGGPGEDHVHHGRQLRRADPPAAAGPAPHPGGGGGAGRRHRAEAGRTGLRLSGAKPELGPSGPERSDESGKHRRRAKRGFG